MVSPARYAPKRTLLPVSSAESQHNLLYSWRTTSTPPAYFCFSPGASCFWPWIWRRTLTRSKGAVMSVMGIAEKKPAAETWATVYWLLCTVVKEETSCLPTS